MPTWSRGTLREDFGPLKKGTTVYYRKFNNVRQLAVGTCWWLRPREPHYYSVAESYGGEGLSSLVKADRNEFGSFVKSPADVAVRLDRGLREFMSKIPSGARIAPSRLRGKILERLS